MYCNIDIKAHRKEGGWTFWMQYCMKSNAYYIYCKFVLVVVSDSDTEIYKCKPSVTSVYKWYHISIIGKAIVLPLSSYMWYYLGIHLWGELLVALYQVISWKEGWRYTVWKFQNFSAAFLEIWRTAIFVPFWRGWIFKIAFT